MSDRFTGEQPAQDGNAAQAWHSVQCLVVLNLHQPADQVNLSLLDADIMDDMRLRDVRFLDTTQIQKRLDARDVDIDVQRYFVRSVNFGQNLDVHADIQKRKLRVDQWIDPDAADAWLKAAGSIGHLVADLEADFLVIHRANLRRLQHLAV